ncbi:hypothetical protein [Massilia antarctica]|uniref:hypothetical protein n=1 Tax=Massilia antarctica TaxID=2765360 RepID=UPI0006BB90AF|nr:hypothetical protein [Massilia sp. H27-R4]MCY0911298.1 hypothetical protein [Massilia sp. H27-R4]CUI05106.1 hypothetical protein BN2497_4989 [Janthinobacterium sp. CG23_2]CUU28892.1 hypothetical protein BN3177_4989 [Janthinobacterium sp. CG23_2]
MNHHDHLQASPGSPGSGRALEAEAALMVRVPAALRAIFHVWAQECDPAPMLPRGGDMQALVAAYVRLSAMTQALPVERELLVRVYVNAALNCEFALWTELRHEAAAVLRWLMPIVAADPALRARVAQAWPRLSGPDGS